MLVFSIALLIIGAIVVWAIGLPNTTTYSGERVMEQLFAIVFIFGVFVAVWVIYAIIKSL